ncbi:MAG: hypothetical protein KKI08_15875, partial [Armatimonadetes bacterium]|nr:hypothetical protein [Armatimonadota bacterium]
MSRARPDRRLLCLALLLGVALSASGADNLAPQAAYAVTIYGFAYRGQVIPGTNTPNTVDGYLPAPPWQGPADTLTDGRRDTPAVESWFWTHMDKRLVATFDLRRQATLTAVRAYLKQGTKDAYSGAEVRIAAEADGLDKAPALPLELTADGAVWQGGPVSGRFVRLTCNSPAPTISLAEVEIEGTSTGDIAPGAPPPGLTPVAPRDLGPLTALPERPAGISNVAARPEVKLTVTSRHYDHKVGAMVDDQCAAESDPGGRALCDGDVKTTVSSFSDYYAHKSITAEFDLGDGFQVDRVVVWSATHEGPPRTYLNSFRVWLQPAAGAAWLPAGETRNPVLPGEKPPAPYPIVSAPLDRPARSVRLRLDGVAQSADVMRVAEIEIWGKALTEPVAALPLRVTAPVPAIAPVALGKLAPAYDWITKRRLRGLYSYVGRSDDEALNQRAVAVGYNCLIVHTMGKSHSEQGWPEEVTRWVEVQKRTPLRVIFSWPFGADERYGNTQFGAYQPGGGDVWKKTPCPLAAEYWNRVVGDRAVIAAKAGLTGMVV